MKANWDAEVIMCDTVRPQTASGKIELFSQNLEQCYGFGTSRYTPAEKDRPLR